MNNRSSVASLFPDTGATPVVGAGRVASVSRTSPSGETVRDLAQIFGLLADPGRLRLLAALLEGGEMCVCDLAAATGQSVSAASHALRLLRMHRVVKVRRSGRMAYHSLADPRVRMLLAMTVARIGRDADGRDDG